MKTLGLALGGGGLKGLAHIGIIQVLQENGFKPQFISGTSSGSIIAALYASGISPYEIEQIVLGLTPDQYLDFNYIGGVKYLLHWLVKGYNYKLSGLIIGDKIEKMIYRLTKGKKLTDIELPLAIIACDIDSGRRIVFTNQDVQYDSDDTLVVKDALLSEAVRASISIPATFEPKQFQGMQLVDGGLKDIVPVMINKFMGAQYILAVSLGQEIYASKVEGIPQIISRTISILTYDTSETEQDYFADLLLSPDLPDVALGDLQAVPQLIRAGRRIMRDNINRLSSGLQ